MNSLNQFNQLYCIAWMYLFIDWKTLLNRYHLNACIMFILVEILMNQYQFNKFILIIVYRDILKERESVFGQEHSGLLSIFINPFMFRYHFYYNFINLFETFNKPII